jgi:ketosteroid isomerase-like protein
VDRDGRDGRGLSRRAGLTAATRARRMRAKHHRRIGGSVGQANVELVRGVYDAFARGDVDAVFAAMTPEIEWDECEGMPYGGVYHGREAIVANVFGPILADVEGFTANPDEILALDEARVIARGRHGGMGAAGPVEARFVHIWTITNGQVSRYEQLADTRKFCDAVGK